MLRMVRSKKAKKKTYNKGFPNHFTLIDYVLRDCGCRCIVRSYA